MPILHGYTPIAARLPRLHYLFILAALLVAIVALASCGGKKGGFPGGVAQVEVVTLKAQDVTLTRELPGRTSAFLVAEVRPQVTGIVKRRLFTEGGTVWRGQVLYELDDAVYQAALNSARATLAKAQASLTAARLQGARSAELRKINAVSAQDDENATAALAQGEAEVSAAQAAVDSAQVNVGYTRISAPISGSIGKSSVTQGALVTANQAAALATVQKLDPIYVDVSQSSSEWLQLKHEIDDGLLQAGAAKAPAHILLEDGSNYAQDGTLQFADVSVDEQTGSLLLRVLVPNPARTLLPGMFVKAVISEGVRKGALLAPQQGIARDPRGNATAMVLEADGKVGLRTVRVSRTIGNQWLVEDGLHAGDRVIVAGLQKVQPGMPAQATEAGTAPAAPATAH